MSDSFSVQDIIFPSYVLASFFPSKSVCKIFFLKSLITPSKIKYLASKIHQAFAQLTDSGLPIISKAFSNNRGQTPKGEGRNSPLLTSTQTVRTDG